MKKANFFIAGVPNAGTTSLHNYLGQHPDIYMSPVKEPSYFCQDVVTAEYTDAEINKLKKSLQNRDSGALRAMIISSFDVYQMLFMNADKESIIGESSIKYLVSKDAPVLISKYNPDSKILFILRDPVRRFFSHYIMHLGKANINEEFSEFVRSVEDKNSRNYLLSSSLIKMSFYSEGLSRYFHLFKKKNIKVIKYEDYKAKPSDSIKSILSFLEVDPAFNIDMSKKHYRSLLPRNRLISFLNKSSSCQWIRDKFLLSLSEESRLRFKNMKETYLFNQRSIPELLLTDWEYLYNLFKVDIKRTEKMTGLDLSDWNSFKKKGNGNE